ncbi:hypothetical protein B0W48_10275 [Pseudoalteromonas aliena]|uniref:Uncharacterized protein n=1 Tax=Pseudoalteromonas aliena TaxID=247523 RepID=A0A1Q2GYD0_9GAMM|nr:hypothetical protein B0W48_10275 [Pseudoalteromonas aliena]
MLNVFITFLLLIKDTFINANFRPTLFNNKNQWVKLYANNNLIMATPVFTDLSVKLSQIVKLAR